MEGLRDYGTTDNWTTGSQGRDVETTIVNRCEGEVVTPLPLGRPLLFVLVCPPVGLSTADVYRGVSVPPQPLTGEEIRQAVDFFQIPARRQKTFHH